MSDPDPTFGYNPDQERDEKGQWAPSGDSAAQAISDRQAARIA